MITPPRVAALYCALVAIVRPSVATSQPAPQLVYTAMVIRHGVRSPTWTDDRLRVYSAAPWPSWGVQPGELTAHGGAIMQALGAYYGGALHDAGLLPRAAGCADTARVFLHADVDQRTLETARALARGLLPSCPVAIHSRRPGGKDALFDPVSTGAVTADGALARASIAGRVGPDPQALVAQHRAAFETLDRILRGTGTAGKRIADEPVTIAVNPKGTSAELAGALATASTMSENLLLEYGNDFRGADLGWGRLTEDDLREVLSLHAAYAELTRRTPYLARARASNLMNAVVSSLAQAAAGERREGSLGTSRTTLLAIVGHDTNISNLSGMLSLTWLLPGYVADDTPPGGALVFSLWKSGSRLLVRTQYIAPTLGQMRGAALGAGSPPAIADVFVPGCSGAANGYACEWSAFERTVRASIDPAFVVKEAGGNQ